MIPPPGAPGVPRSPDCRNALNENGTVWRVHADEESAPGPWWHRTGPADPKRPLLAASDAAPIGAPSWIDVRGSFF